VWKRLGKGESPLTVTLELEGISKNCQNDILDRFWRTGGVDTWQGRREAPPANRVIDGADDLWLLGDVLDDPTATLCARAATFRRVRGKTVHLSSICRALRRLGLTHGRLQNWASERDDLRCHAFLVELMTFYSMHELLTLDETSKDRRALKASFGWHVRGCPGVEGAISYRRGDRWSALCIFSPRGFEDWRLIEGNFDAELFTRACGQMLLPAGPPGVPPLVRQFKATLMDNASIHTDALQNAINTVNPHHKVIRIPPYSATKLSPLDNGAFGCLVCATSRT
jgi:hypothetical protein